MISYCYADKDIVHKIQKFLDNEGYDVWSARTHKNREGKIILKRFSLA